MPRGFVASASARLTIAVVFLFLCFGACARGRAPLDPAMQRKLEGVVPYRTTHGEVLHAFGQPKAVLDATGKAIKPFNPKDIGTPSFYALDYGDFLIRMNVDTVCEAHIAVDGFRCMGITVGETGLDGVVGALGQPDVVLNKDPMGLEYSASLDRMVYPARTGDGGTSTVFRDRERGLTVVLIGGVVRVIVVSYRR